MKNRILQEDIEKGLKQLPVQEQNKIIEEEKRKERLEVKETKKNLWKLRTKEKKLEKLSEQQETIRKLDNMKEKLTTIEETTINLRNEREQESEKKRLRKEKLDKEWKEKVKKKYQKELDKKEQQRQISQRWNMLSWITDYIENHQDQWDKEQQEKEKLAQEEIENWKKMKRLDKIKHLKQKWDKINQDKTEQENPEQKIDERNDNWKVWRIKETKEKIDRGFDTVEIYQNDQVQEVPRYELTNIKLRTPRIFKKKEISGEDSKTSTVPPDNESYKESSKKESDISTIPPEGEKYNEQLLEYPSQPPSNPGKTESPPEKESQEQSEDYKIVVKLKKPKPELENKESTDFSKMKDNQKTKDNNKTQDNLTKILPIETKPNNDNLGKNNKTFQDIVKQQPAKTTLSLRPPSSKENPKQKKKDKTKGKQTKTETNKNKRITDMFKKKEKIDNKNETTVEDSNLFVLTTDLDLPESDTISTLPKLDLTMGLAILETSINNPDLDKTKNDEISLSKKLVPGSPDPTQNF